VIPYIDMLATRMMHGILGEFDGTLVVVIYWSAIVDFHIF